MAITHQMLACHCALCYLSFPESPSKALAGIIGGSVGAAVLMVVVIVVISIVIKHHLNKSQAKMVSPHNDDISSENRNMKSEIDISNLDDGPKDVTIFDAMGLTNKPSYPAIKYVLAVDMMHGHKDNLPQIN